MAYCLTIIVQRRMIHTFLIKKKKKRLGQIPGSTVRKTDAKGKGKVTHYNRMSFLRRKPLYQLWLMAECVVYYCFLYEWHVVHFPLYYYVYAHEFLLFSCPVLYESLLMQRTRLPSLSPSPGACSNSRPSNQCILSCPLLFLHSVFPSIRVFSNELALCIRWPKYWSFSISPIKRHLCLFSNTSSFC